MIVREKHTGEEYPLKLEMMLSTEFPLPGSLEEWEIQDEPFCYRNTLTGEVRYPPPGAQWCINLPELLETDVCPTRNLARRHTGNWNLVPPGQDDDYEFIPETEDERRTLKENGFTISEKGD